MNYTFSFFNVLLMYATNRNPDCPHILYNEDIGASCCQKDIIELHSIQRVVTTPLISAERTPNMTWNGELAKKAQDIVRKCKFKYEPVEGGRLHTGQNMYLKCSNSDDIEANWSEPIQYWFSEDKIRPNYARTTSGSGQSTWKKLHSLQVGCGYANYKIKETDFFVEKRVGIRISRTGKDFCQVYACVYGPV
ncbi:cysteine-rich secretory protein 3-like [Anoplophora glabripennis]|uniref:cysteine-rich secretory protein 3-like n=1 Tax=Anoplophora glabripennis TaxID=217634 RepID=UPI0008743144|nr:cysteine-rich secretory protein 3-like [Anoplophora glabripennis]